MTPPDPSRHTIYRQRNPEKVLWSAARRRATKLGVPFTINVEDVTIPKTCPALGMTLASNRGGTQQHESSPTLDRIIPELGYVPGNVIVISSRANRIKSDSSVAELRRLARFYTERITHRDRTKNP